MSKPLVLASTSPFRKALLEQLGFDFITCQPEVDERELEENHKGSVNDLPAFLSEQKAKSIASRFPGQVIIGSDQMLIFQGQGFHKPETMAEVVERLMSLQGQTHELHTGLCLIYKDKIHISTVVARMTMRPLSREQAQTYAELDRPMGCAGGYKIEKKGPLLFSAIETSDHTSIVGLPALSLVSKLNEWGFSRL